MPDVVCGERNLARVRPNQITQRLRKVSDSYLFIEPKQLPYEFSLVARSGAKITSDEQRSRFPSSVDTIVCEYMESWIPAAPNAQEFKLKTIYFQLLEHRGREENPRDIIAFHWEPLADAEDEADLYKSRPHLHVKLATGPLPRSHLDATLSVGTDQQGSVEYLDQLLDEAIAMIAIEVLERIRSTPLA